MNRSSEVKQTNGPRAIVKIAKETELQIRHGLQIGWKADRWFTLCRAKSTRVQPEPTYCLRAWRARSNRSTMSLEAKAALASQTDTQKTVATRAVILNKS
jgi:hypothetical protein